MHCMHLHTSNARVNPLDALVSSSNVVSHYYFSADWLLWLLLLVDDMSISASVAWIAEFLRFPVFWAGVPLFGVKKSISGICSGNAWIQIWGWIWFTHNHLEPISSNENYEEHIVQNLSDVLGWQNTPWLRQRFVPYNVSLSLAWIKFLLTPKRRTNRAFLY